MYHERAMGFPKFLRFCLTPPQVYSRIGLTTKKWKKKIRGDLPDHCKFKRPRDAKRKLKKPRKQSAKVIPVEVSQLLLPQDTRKRRREGNEHAFTGARQSLDAMASQRRKKRLVDVPERADLSTPCSRSKVVTDEKSVAPVKIHANHGRGAYTLSRRQSQDLAKSGRDFAVKRSPSTLIAAARKHSTVKTRTSFLQKMQSRLIGGQFRMLNEKLYTCSGEDALRIFKDDPTTFQLYHAGYQEQMSQWPRQPVESILEWLQARSPHLVVADFGCGDGRLGRSLQNKVFSLDLVAVDSSIIACNMANTPLRMASIDVAVFCLSLMGTDYPSFLEEARRVLKPRGSLLIAEVRSRFDPGNGGADPQHFIRALNRFGFSLVLKDFSNKMFIMLHFQKESGKALGVNELEWPMLKPCIYKRR